MKKFYFYSVFRSLIYLFIALHFSGMMVLCFFADEIHSGVIFCIVSFFIMVTILLFWFGFSLSMRIQFDFFKSELYIRTYYFIRKIKFEDIKSIEIIEYNKVAFEFIVNTNEFSQKIVYSRYLHKRPNKKIISKLNDLKFELMKISNHDNLL